MNYSTTVQKALGRLINDLSVEDYLALLDDCAKHTDVADLTAKHQALIRESKKRK